MTQHLEQLIGRYEDAVFDPLFDPDTCALLAQQVQAAALHDAAQQHRLQQLAACHHRAAAAHDAAN